MKDFMISRNKFLDALALDADNKTDLIQVHQALEKAVQDPDEVRGVVHCKDCKWCHAGYCEKYDDLIPLGCANKPWEDWFCADGKRREAKKEAQDAD